MSNTGNLVRQLSCPRSTPNEIGHCSLDNALLCPTLLQIYVHVQIHPL